MAMYTTASMERLTQGAKGTNSQDKNGKTHVTAYTNTNRVSYDVDKSGKVSEVHTTNNNRKADGSKPHYNIEKR
ncbi:MAG: hypothetical protein FWC16_10435 [Defluviitaleaceae bacterium]|nr:hypothetical protein [Defluviitaleaceae bacterium]MCL2275333.1 hypothetical protein [Defluviitaleaceae bacterium]